MSLTSTPSRVNFSHNLLSNHKNNAFSPSSSSSFSSSASSSALAPGINAQCPRQEDSNSLSSNESLRHAATNAQISNYIGYLLQSREEKFKRSDPESDSATNPLIPEYAQQVAGGNQKSQQHRNSGATEEGNGSDSLSSIIQHTRRASGSGSTPLRRKRPAPASTRQKRNIRFDDSSAPHERIMQRLAEIMDRIEMDSLEKRREERQRRNNQGGKMNADVSAASSAAIAKSDEFSDDSHNNVVDKLTEDLVGLASELKQRSKAIHAQIDEDNPIIDEQHDLQEKNIEQSNKETSTLRKHVATLRSTIFQQIFQLVLAAALFVFMMLLIQMFPKQK